MIGNANWLGVQGPLDGENSEGILGCFFRDYKRFSSNSPPSFLGAKKNNP